VPPSEDLADPRIEDMVSVQEGSPPAPVMQPVLVRSEIDIETLAEHPVMMVPMPVQERIHRDRLSSDRRSRPDWRRVRPSFLRPLGLVYRIADCWCVREAA
jgi:hypothetical protein